MGRKSYLGCEVDGCDAHIDKGDSILRTSPLGGPFWGRCKKHLTPAQVRILEADEAAVAAHMRRLN